MGKAVKSCPLNKTPATPPPLPPKPNMAKTPPPLPPKKPLPPPLPPKKLKPSTKISIACGHGRTKPYPFEGLYEIVPDVPAGSPGAPPSTAYKETVTVAWSATAPDPPPPPELEVYDRFSSVLKKYSGPSYSVELSIDPKDFLKTGIAGFFKGLITRAHTYNQKKTYGINSYPGWVNSDEVVIYNPEIWQLTLGIPDGFFNANSDLMGNNAFNSVYKTGTPYDNSPPDKTTAAIGYADTSADWAAQSVQLTCNGAKIQSKGMEALSSALTIVATIMDIVNAIQNFTPQVGWYFQVQYSILQGQVQFTWGWKEYTDQRAYYYFKAGGEIKVFSLSIEIGAGANGVIAKVQVFAKGSGDVTWKPSVEHNQPGKKFDVEMAFAGTISLAIGARFEVLLLIKVEATLNTGITITGTFIFTPDDPLKKTLDVTFNGVYAELSIGVGPVGAFAVNTYRKIKSKITGGTFTKVEQTDWKGTINVINARTLGHWEWPDEQKISPDKLAPATMRDYFETMLHGGYTEESSLTFRKDAEGKNKSEYTLLNTEVVPNSEIAKALQEKASKWATDNKVFFKPLDPSGASSLNGLLIKMRKDLVALAVDTSKIMSKYVKYDDFDTYLNGAFVTTLNKNLIGISTLVALAPATP